MVISKNFFVTKKNILFLEEKQLKLSFFHAEKVISENYSINQDYTILEQFDDNFSSEEIVKIKENQMTALLRSNLFLNFFSHFFQLNSENCFKMAELAKPVFSSSLENRDCLNEFSFWQITPNMMEVGAHFLEIFQEKPTTFDSKKITAVTLEIEKISNFIQKSENIFSGTLMKVTSLYFYYVLNSCDLILIVFGTKFKPNPKKKESPIIVEARLLLKKLFVTVLGVWESFQTFIPQMVAKKINSSQTQLKNKDESILKVPIPNFDCFYF